MAARPARSSRASMLPIRPVVNTPESDASEESVLPEDALRRVDELGSTDLLVGIPCFDNANTIGGVVVAVEAGLRMQFPDLRAVICASEVTMPSDASG